MPATPTPRCAVYARISRDRTGAGLGVERQVNDCRDLAERSGWTVIDPPFTDNDLSAYSGKPRPAYRRLLAAIERGEIDRIVCWHTDRLHRSPAELEEWITVCEPRGVGVHTVKAGLLDLATPAGRMVARQLGAVARYESEHRSERVAAKMLDIARNGGFLGGVRPFGYLDKGMQLHPVEAPLIADATHTILRGGSLREIVKTWNAAGVTTTKAKSPWAPATVRDVLTRPRNAALLEHRGQVVGPAAWPPIITEDEWRGVCVLLSDESRRTSPGNDPRWLGSGLYRCGVCGDGMVVGTSGQQRHPSYRCRRQKRGGPRHVTRAARSLDAYVEMLIIGWLSRDDVRERLVPADPDIDVPAIRTELAQIEAQRAALAERLGRGQISIAMLDAANGPLLQRKTDLNDTLARAATTSPVAVLISAEDVAEAWAALALPARRRILDTLMTVTVHPAPRGRRPDGTYFDPDSVQIEWKGNAK